MRALESPELTKSFTSQHLLTEYLVARTRSDHINRQYKLTGVVFDTIDYIRQLNAAALGFEHDYIYDVCLAVVQSETRPPQRIGSIQHLSLPVHEILCQPVTDHSLAQNALALSAYLGLIGVLQQLIEQGIDDVRTCFGLPLYCVVIHPDSSATSAYLKARRQQKEDNPPAVTTKEDFCHEDHSAATLGTCHPKNIPKSKYDGAIRRTIRSGVPKTVEILVESAVEDDPAYIFWDHRKGPARIFGSRETRQNEDKNLSWSCILLYAVRFMRTDIVKLALNHGANANVETSRFVHITSTLEIAARNGDICTFRLLLDNGADIHLTHQRHTRLLMYAVEGESLEIVSICLENGVLIHEDHYWHFCALEAAVFAKRPDMLNLLLAGGLDFEPGERLDRKLVELAEESESSEINLILDAFGRKSGQLKVCEFLSAQAQHTTLS